jgi:hypothetical protein
MELEMEAKIQ